MVDAVIVPIAGPTSAAPTPAGIIPIRAIPARTVANDIDVAVADVDIAIADAIANPRSVRPIATDDRAIADSGTTSPAVE